MGEAETLLLKFDAQPGQMLWQLIGAVPSGDAGGQQQGSLYLRGHPPDQEGKDGWNHLDPTRVKRWEVAVVPGGRESGSQMTWLKTKLRMVRGEEGRVLAGIAPPPDKEEL